MPDSKNDQVGRVSEELSVLDRIIDYADEMIFEQSRSEYRSLRRYAYGKTVVIKTEKLGTQTFRLSSTSVVYPNRASGYATPHSPVGRLCGFLQPGDSDETPGWGEYDVLEVRLLDRFDGPQFEQNVRNFLRMVVKDEAGEAEVFDLRSFLAHKATRPTPLPIAATEDGTPPPVPAKPQDQPSSPAFDFNKIAIVDDEPEGLAAPLEFEEDITLGESASPDAGEYFGLSEAFFVDRTREQDLVISRSPVGPMFVEGVAGSGKTSAALGRTKMLCDFNTKSLVSEVEFREIVGEGLDYWEGAFAGQFSQESSVGFVRTGELIQYLKETCRRLDLPNLPVLEYPELRNRLQQHRRVNRNRVGQSRWAGASTPRPADVDTTIAWLKAADRALASHWATTLVDRVPTAEQIASKFSQAVRPFVLQVAAVASARLQTSIGKLVPHLTRIGGADGYVLDGLATKIREHIQQVLREVLEKDVLWVTIGHRSWTAKKERDLAEQLVKARVPLFLHSNARLVFLGENGPLDDSLTLLSVSGDPIIWGDGVRQQLDQGLVSVKDADGLTVPARPSDVENLYLRLLPEATESLYVLRDGALRRMVPRRGLGRALFALQPAPGASQGANEKQSSIYKLFSNESHKSLLEPLTFLADAYAETLVFHPSAFPNKDLAIHIGDQLHSRSLAEHDVDLLLCLANIVGRGFSGAPPGLQALNEPTFYQSVFIDEVQDFTEQQIFLMVEQARPEYRAITVVGDLAQKLHNGETIDVPACLPGQSLKRVQLTENLRQLDSPGLAWFSACVRAYLHEGLTHYVPNEKLRARLETHSHRLRGPELRLLDHDDELTQQVVDALTGAAANQTLAVVFPDPESASALFERCYPALRAHMLQAELSQKIDLSRRHIRHFTSVNNAKGLEFDVVLVPYLERYDLTNPSHANHLYVAITRARQTLVLLSDASHANPRFESIWEAYHQWLT